MITAPGVVRGAKYCPGLPVVQNAELALGQMIPTVAFPPGMSLTDHMSAVFEVPVTVAVNCKFSDVPIVAVGGDI